MTTTNTQTTTQALQITDIQELTMSGDWIQVGYRQSTDNPHLTLRFWDMVSAGRTDDFVDALERADGSHLAMRQDPDVLDRSRSRVTEEWTKVTPENVEVGMGATESIGSDRYPFQVVRVNKSRTVIFVKPMKRVECAGCKGVAPNELNQVECPKHGTGYAWEVSEAADEIRISWRKGEKRWRQSGATGARCGYFAISASGGVRFYQDPCF